MSTVVQHERREAAEAQERWTKGRAAHRLTPTMIENGAIFAVAFTVYALFGIWLVVHEHVLVFDGLSRLSHAYFVWWNSPPKLTAIGFVWPPVATLVFLPFAAIKPLATSLVALPACSAVFGALLLVLLNRVFTVVQMPWWQRYTLVTAFGANPMIAFYAANGMAEILYLCLLVGGIYAYLRWHLTRSPGALIFASASLALGILSRYEVFMWAALLTFAIAFIAMRQRVTRSELEGTLLTFLAPVTYGVGLWLFFNWLILGSPIFFLRQQTPGAPISPGAAAVAIPRTTLGPAQLGARIAELNWELFPPTILVFAALLVVLFVRRDLMTLSLAAMVVLNAATTWLIVVGSGAESYLQLRYNMRAMPIALAAVGWLYLLARGRDKTLVWAAATVSLLVAIPFTLHTMSTFKYQFREVDFVHAVEGKGGIPDQLADERKVDRWIDGHVRGNNTILTDDSQTFAAMLLTGKPALFLDRIDRGDGEWLDIRDNPWGRVRYFLVITGGPDLILQRYPTLVSGDATGLTTVFRTGKYAIVRVARVAPRRRRI